MFQTNKSLENKISQSVSAMRNVKGRSPGKTNVITNRKWDPHKIIQIFRKRYRVNTKDFFSSVLIIAKHN